MPWGIKEKWDIVLILRKQCYFGNCDFAEIKAKPFTLLIYSLTCEVNTIHMGFKQ